MAGPTRRRAGRWLFGCLFAVLLVGPLAAYGGPLLFQLHGQRLFVLTSGSMTGTYDAGTAVVTVPITADQLRVGQVVTFRASNGEYVTHRIVRLVTMPKTDNDGVVVRDPSGRREMLYFAQTKGDSNEDPDPDLAPVGQVRFLVVGGYPHLGTVLVWSRTPLGKLVLFLPPFLLLIGAELLSWRRSDRSLRNTDRDHPEAEHVQSVLV